MLSLFLLVIGIVIILISTIFILNQSNPDDADDVSDEVLKNDDELVITIESLENIIYDINHTFNNTINEFEKKYERLENKIHHVDRKASENYEHVTQPNVHNNDNYENNINNNIDNIVDNKNPIVEKSFLSSDRATEIIELKNKGLSVQQIARELNIGTGEVILILNLKKTKG
ncbi:hypothetical protein R9X47_02040 [Wukongibacter baidiensis]|uniref:DUF6115 domain-containing protein n=1 Tax=Wukongibacter baidiensis TaxID=1723361 RepID=UPI003D7F4DD0